MPLTSSELLKMLGGDGGCVLLPFGSGVTGSLHKQFDSSGFKGLVRSKVRLILHLLASSNADIIFSDVDVAFKRKVLPVLESLTDSRSPLVIFSRVSTDVVCQVLPRRWCTLTLTERLSHGWPSRWLSCMGRQFAVPEQRAVLLSKH